MAWHFSLFELLPMKNFCSKLAIFNVSVIINGCKNVVLKNADFFHIWPNFCPKFADDMFWHLATVTPSASRLFDATSNRLPLQILNETQVPTTTTLGFPSIYLYTLWVLQILRILLWLGI
jgi:hypothetical protein